MTALLFLWNTLKHSAYQQHTELSACQYSNEIHGQKLLLKSNSERNGVDYVSIIMNFGLILFICKYIADSLA